MQSQSTLPPLPQQPEGVEIRYLPDWIGYAVTSTGEVWSCRGNLPFVYRKWRQLRPSANCRGYKLLHLRNGTKTSTVPVHRAIATAFHGPCPEGLDCRHLNGIKADNRSANLQWGTRSENNLDKKRHGIVFYGERCNSAVLKEVDVLFIRANAGNGFTKSALAKKFGVSKSAIKHIVARRNWPHI